MDEEEERTKKIEELRKLKEPSKKIKAGLKEQKPQPIEIRELRLKIAELTEILQRLQAEFENYKKRVDREKQEFVKYAEEKLILGLLPVLDSFEFALKNTTDKEKFSKGVEMIFAQFYSVLESEGLKPIEAIGKKFDPYKHEVLIKAVSDKDEDIVIEELQKGYMLNDRVIRHSKVKVSHGKKDDNKTNAAKKDS